MESEYIAACEASNEALWLKKFVIELGVFPSCTDPMGIFCDNTGAIANAKEPRTHSTAKHIRGGGELPPWAWRQGRGPLPPWPAQPPTPLVFSPTWGRGGGGTPSL